MPQLLARLWKQLRGGLQWRALWLFNATFMIGVTGIVRDDVDRILLLRHRFWPEHHPWGLPTGYARKREDLRDTIVRELREETGLSATVGSLVSLTSGYRLRLEVAYQARVPGTDTSPRPDGFEVLEARWFDPDDLPAELLEPHRRLIAIDHRDA